MSILLVVGGFLAGAIPFGVLVARGRGVDIRTQGSGNIGATNVGRVLGVGPGLLVLALDAAKGALAVLAASRLDGAPWIVAATGLGAIAGHCFSPFLGGKGGKGVATALGVFGAISPALAVVGVAVFALIAGRTRIPALGSLAGTAAATGFAFATHAGAAVCTLALATQLLLFWTHRGNIVRLLTNLT